MMEVDKLYKQLNIDENQIKQRGRSLEVSTKRHLIWYILHKKGVSYKDIALFYNRNRSSVLLGINGIASLLSINDKYLLDILRESEIDVDNI